GENAKAEDDPLENALDSLRRLFLGPGIPSTPYKAGAGGAGDFDARNSFYNNLSALETSAEFKAASGQLRFEALAGKSADELEDEARTNVAIRYALKELNPYIIAGADSLYASLNRNGELDLFNPSTQTG